jgi:hypothetical protein
MGIKLDTKITYDMMFFLTDLINLLEDCSLIQLKGGYNASSRNNKS